MPDYQAMYFRLFNGVTDAVRILQEAQLEGEKTYIESEDAVIHILRAEDEDDAGEDETPLS